MKRTVQILTGILLIAGFSVSMTALAWSTTIKEMLYLPLWLISTIGLILTFSKLKAGLYIILTSSILWLIQMAETFGWFLTFEIQNLALWGVIALPVFISLMNAILTSRILLSKFNKIRLSTIVIAIIIPAAGFISYADKTYTKNIFSEYYDVAEEKYRAIFRAGPADTRYFTMTMESDEVRKLVTENATFVAGHHYFPNTKFRVRMTFNKITEVEIYKLDGYELTKPIKWRIEELNGHTEFLKY